MADMTEAELTAEIAIFRTAIKNVALTGQRYEVGSGASRRVFEADLDKLRSYLTSLQNDLREVQETSGVQMGF